jgi:hypothetical protein
MINLEYFLNNLVAGSQKLVIDLVGHTIITKGTKDGILRGCKAENYIVLNVRTHSYNADEIVILVFKRKEATDD